MILSLFFFFIARLASCLPWLILDLAPLFLCSHPRFVHTFFSTCCCPFLSLSAGLAPQPGTGGQLLIIASTGFVAFSALA